MKILRGVAGNHFRALGMITKMQHMIARLVRQLAPIVGRLLRAIYSIPIVGPILLGATVIGALVAAAYTKNPVMMWAIGYIVFSPAPVGIAALLLTRFVLLQFSPVAGVFSVAALFNPLMRSIRPARLIDWLATRYTGSPDALLRGDLAEAAQERYPASKFSWLYRVIPSDIRRPVLFDGRTPNGGLVTELVWRDLSPEIVEKLAQDAAETAKRWAASLSVAALATNLVWLLRVTPGLDIPPPPYSGVPWWSGVGGVLDWGWIYVSTATGYWVSLAICWGLSLLVVPPIVFLAVQWLAYVTALGSNLARWLSLASHDLRQPTRDALVLHPSRVAERINEMAVYARQVEDATGRLAADPLIPIGRATGTFRARGCNEAPVAGQMVSLDYESVKQSLMVLGGTGTGKTRLVLKPFAGSVLRLASVNRKIGMMVVDGKGVLHGDLLEMPEIADRDDVVVVGTEAGQVGIDLIGGLSPLDVATIAETVSVQLMHESGGFWSASASLLVLHSAVLARIIAADPEMDAYLGVPAWSLAGVYAVAKLPSRSDNPRARQLSAITARIEAMRGELIDDLPPALRALVLQPETSAALAWFADAWAPMADQTRSGIGAHLDSVFGRFMGSGKLVEAFGSGPRPGSVSVDHALRGGILMIAVGTASWGAAGHLVAVWLKTMLFMRARQMLQTERASRKTTLCVLLADEYQMLVTASEHGSGKDDDSNMWNISRECGICLVAAAQSVVALQMAIGEKPAKNLLQQMRSKIFLSTDELETINFAREISGKIVRGLILNADGIKFHETVATRELALPHRQTAAPDHESILTSLIRWFTFSTPNLDPVARVDRRFLITGMEHDQDGPAALGAMQAAHWRAADQSRAALMAAEPVDKLMVEDMQLGHGFAFAMIQRAGVDRADIIDLRAVLEQAAPEIEAEIETHYEELV